MFDALAGGTVNAWVATFFISLAQAIINLEQVVGGRTFEDLRVEADDAWNGELRRVDVDTSASERRKFYSCLYRCLQFPRKFYEIDD